ncbi:MAG: YceI family protein [Hyphomonadaceae bacterium]
MRILALFAVATALAACSPQPATQDAETSAAQTGPIVPEQTTLPAGEYTLDKSHASFVFRVDHLGFSRYTARFTDFDAQLQLDPANPTAAQINVEINPNSLQADNAPAGFLNELRGAQWINAAAYPAITYRSTSVELTAPNAARIVGDLTLHGVTRPVTLEATFNGGWEGHPQDPNARIGFSARGTIKRSDFGISYGLPQPPMNIGVGDEVTIEIETEFTGPAWTPPANTTTP